MNRARCKDGFFRSWNGSAFGRVTVDRNIREPDRAIAIEDSFLTAELIKM